MTFPLKTFGALSACALLAACGGGGGGGPQTVFQYQTFDSTVPGDRKIAAAGLTRPTANEYPDGTVVEVGTLTIETDGTNILDIAGIITSGTKNGDSWTSGTTTVAASPTLFIDRNFSFLVPVDVTEDGAAAGTYIVGVVARTEDLPTTGGKVSFTYSGSARVEGILDSATATPVNLASNGELALTADFGNDLVDVVISQLTQNSIPFDTVTINGLSISSGPDATFANTASSRFQFEKNGETYLPDFGGDATESASGAFFGGDGTAPSEAGGAFSVNGTNGNTIFGIFAADVRQ